MFSLSKTALILTAVYFVLWCAGPVLIDETWLWFGMPVWFWFSCIVAPVALISSLIFLVGFLQGNADD
ncbi:DUF997 family protein [Shewanella woodyi]|uniref:DUF997 family protein n=1 Tax=Shewanella woodyi (strain ATCC 51908 / MS32) TaxID=392500 RepID=B1KJW6_SHEWM|nr:DUF997 family protein [Shewanella woodyi]ACA87153.1 conserved hypothetical protein [Shewanella woodyi ATCC 51908]